jgi:hypothetical protein
MAASRRPFAWIGERGMTTLIPGAPMKNPWWDQRVYPYSRSTYLWALGVVQPTVAYAAYRRADRQAASWWGVGTA